MRKARPNMPIVLTTLVADFRYGEIEDTWLCEANVAIQEIAVKYGCALADIHRAIDHQKTLYQGEIHPNDDGATVMAETIYRAMHAPITDTRNLRVTFDQGSEMRFMHMCFNHLLLIRPPIGLK